ncbi:MAG: hypothetical protein U0798_17560 [Gemmataceae bacterium]
MPTWTNPEDLSPDDRFKDVVTLLATGFRRFCDRQSLTDIPPVENLPNSTSHHLEPVSPNPLTVPVG